MDQTVAREVGEALNAVTGSRAGQLAGLIPRRAWIEIAGAGIQNYGRPIWEAGVLPVYIADATAEREIARGLRDHFQFAAIKSCAARVGEAVEAWERRNDHLNIGLIIRSEERRVEKER